MVGALVSWPSARGGAARISAAWLAVAEPEEAVRKIGTPRQDTVKHYLGLHMQLGQVDLDQNLSWFVQVFGLIKHLDHTRTCAYMVLNTMHVCGLLFLCEARTTVIAQV